MELVKKNKKDNFTTLQSGTHRLAGMYTGRLPWQVSCFGRTIHSKDTLEELLYDVSFLGRFSVDNWLLFIARRDLHFMRKNGERQQ